MQTDKRVFKYVLKNGLTLLVCPKKFASKVSLQLWYNVGSKHEATGEKGMAHFIEHMIFKGTQKMLSESDINLITQKLSGYANAFTSYDYTGYLFDLPIANWDKVLPVFADCMQNCTFDQDHMNSEVKAVIQELKMYRDDFTWTLCDGLVGTIFESHPYHHPIIGYKQDLWNLKRETLLNFYKKYYIPQNGALVIVGDLDPEQVFEKVQQEFGHIARGIDLPKSEFFINEELQAKTLTIYRDTKQATCMLAYVLEGAKEKKEFLYDLLAYLLANGKASRLHKILIDERELVISVHASTYDLFDREIFFIEFKPKHEKDIATIKEIILQEIHDLSSQGVAQQELQRALKLAQVDYQELLEDVQKQAYAIGKAFTACGDEQYPFTYCNYNKDTIARDIQQLLQQYFRPSLCHQGGILQVAEHDKQYLTDLQQQSDELDSKILLGKERETQVAPGRYVDEISVGKLNNTSFPSAQKLILKNGLTVLLYKNTDVDLVEIQLTYKANHHFGKQGVAHITSKLMLEGTKSYPANTFMLEAESNGISIASTPGAVYATALGSDAHHALLLLGDMMQQATMQEANFKKLVSKTKTQLTQFWDTPKSCIAQVAAEKIYVNHAYSHLSWGTQESLASMTHGDCIDFYKNMISPQEAIFSIVGNFDQASMIASVEKYFASWKGNIIADIEYPALKSVHHEVINIEKHRDQIVLAFAGLSVERMHPSYNALSIFDQILSGGMSSKLFDLREQSGLFYTIGGSVVRGSDKQPGMIYICTIVSRDRLEEAQNAITHCLNTAIDSVTESEFDQAKEVVVNGIPELFDSNEAMSKAFIFLEKYKLPADYFKKYIDEIRSVKFDDMKHIVKKYLNTKNLVYIRIGRV